MTNSYTFERQNVEEHAFFQMKVMSFILQMEENLSKLIENENNSHFNNQKNKGIAIFSILIVLLSWFFFSLLKTMFTNPGLIPYVNFF